MELEELCMIKEEYSLAQKETSMKNIDSRTILISVLSAGFAGLFSEIAYFPLDSIKTRIQATTKRMDFVKTSENISKMKGVSAIMIVSVPNAMTFFFFYDKSKQLLSLNTSFHPALIHTLSAAVGEIFGNMVRNPFELIKQQMQVGWNPTLRSTFREIYKLNGFAGFYEGYFSLILREVPFSMIAFPIYEYYKKRALRNKKELSLIDNIVGGFLAGGIGAALTNPIDVVKTRLMTQRDKYYASTFNCFKSIKREEGFKGFAKGIHIRTAALGFFGTVFFGMYENIKLSFDKIVPNF